jgi:hypothetical protein
MTQNHTSPVELIAAPFVRLEPSAPPEPLPSPDRPETIHQSALQTAGLLLVDERTTQIILNLVRQLVSGERDCPRLILLEPVKMNPRQAWAKIRRPHRWFTRKYKLYIICPVTLEICNGSGYSLHVTDERSEHLQLLFKYSLLVLHLILTL